MKRINLLILSFIAIQCINSPQLFGQDGITVVGETSCCSAANQLSYPAGVFLDATGNIFVADAGNNRIQRWAPGATQGVTVAGGNGPGSAANQLAAPPSFTVVSSSFGVFVDASGNIFVADYNNNRIQK